VRTGLGVVEIEVIEVAVAGYAARRIEDLGKVLMIARLELVGDYRSHVKRVPTDDKVAGRAQVTIETAIHREGPVPSRILVTEVIVLVPIPSEQHVSLRAVVRPPVRASKRHRTNINIGVDVAPRLVTRNTHVTQFDIV